MDRRTAIKELRKYITNMEASNELTCEAKRHIEYAKNNVELIIDNNYKYLNLSYKVIIKEFKHKINKQMKGA